MKKFKALFISVGVLLFSQYCFAINAVQAAAPKQQKLAQQNLKELSHAIEAFIQEQTPLKKSERMEVKVGHMDARWHLASCDEPPQFYLPTMYQSGMRRTVRVQCTGTQPWQIYVPVIVHVFTPIIVANRHIARGEVLNKADVRRMVRDRALLHHGYFNQLSQVMGKAARYPIPNNQPITPRNTKAPTVVHRGQGVIILAQVGSLHVEMKGVAMKDGGKGDTILVRNRDSKRIIDAKVLDSDRVLVPMR